MAVVKVDAIGRKRIILSNSERFWAKVDKKTNDRCWNWLAHKSIDGYGIFDMRLDDGSYSSIPASRFAYSDKRGIISDGFQIDHLCRNRLCCNPLHLEAVSQQENINRGEVNLVPFKKKQQRTHCPQGHPYDLTNTYFRPNGSRECRMCRQKTQKPFYERRGGII